MIRVRFAPSPTGLLHIGGARTALFNWLYARSQKGAFILRIEDTDAARSKQEYVDEILGSLSWLGFAWDELYYQSKRLDIYREHAQKLLDAGLAYKEGEAIIFKVPEKKIKMFDLIRGEIEFDADLIKDQVLIKSDGMPTYNFACVVDDAMMNITHIIRGDDHISNTPKQIVIYEALGFALPKFAHLPLIMDEEGGRMSKRTGATAISEYRQMGYLPEAIVNYFLLLGWSPGANQEIIPIKSALEKFSIKKVNKAAAAFSLDKLNWINNYYIKHADAGRLADMLIPLLQQKGLLKEKFDRNQIAGVVQLFQSRLSTLADFLERADFYFLDEPVIDAEAGKQYLSKDLKREFGSLIARLKELKGFEAPTVEKSFREAVAELKIDASDLVHPVRVALTGKAVGPGLFETMELLGKDRVIARLEKIIGGKR